MFIGGSLPMDESAGRSKVPVKERDTLKFTLFIKMVILSLRVGTECISLSIFTY